MFADWQDDIYICGYYKLGTTENSIHDLFVNNLCYNEGKCLFLQLI